MTDIVDVAVENPIERDICSHPIVDDNAYTFVEEKPKFGNGYDDILSYISENIKYPDSAREMSIQGMIVLKFLVEKDGSVSNVHAIRGIEDASLREEAIRVVKNMPKWKAGRQNGVNVRVWYVLPILFKL